MRQRKQEDYFRNVFNSVYQHYLETRESNTTIKTPHFYTTEVIPSAIILIKPTESDFICDFVLAARGCLPNHLWKKFKGIYLDINEWFIKFEKKRYSSVDYLKLLHDLETAVGKQLLILEIYPIQDYMRGKRKVNVHRSVN